MKKFKVLLIALALVIATVLAILDHNRRNYSGNEYLYAKVGDEKINLYEDEESYYLFLPSYADESAVKYSASARRIIADSSSDDSAAGASPVGNLSVLQSANISTIFITTQSGSLENIYADKEYKERGKIRVYDESGALVLAESLSYLTGHGNYTWNSEVWDKKPFGFKLKSSESVLGLPAASKYTLVANASDPTLVRNDIARSMEEVIEIPNAHRGVFADLYINGDYMGCYYLVDNIANSEAYASDGYLLEREFEDRFKIEEDAITKGVTIESGEHFIVKSPDDPTSAELANITQYLGAVDSAINTTASGDAIDLSEYIDISSFAKRYLVEEVTKNYDAGISSAYFYLSLTPGADAAATARLYYAPGWDYDMSMGSYLDWMDYADPAVLTYASALDDNNEWPKKLYNYTPFQQQFLSDYREKLLPYLEWLTGSDDGTTVSGLQYYQDLLSASSSMDAIRWQSMYEKCGYTVGSSESFDYLRTFLSTRTAFLNSVWLE